MGFRWGGLEEFGKALQEMAARVDEGTRLAVQEGIVLMETQAKLNATSGKHKKGQPHIPGSGPGPNVVSGNLRRSITHTRPERRGVTGWYARMGPTAVYGRAVELGLWQNPSAKFPYIGPAVKWVTGGPLILVIRNAWTKALSR